MYLIVREKGYNINFNTYKRGVYRVLNTKTNILCNGEFKTLKQVKAYITDLQCWEKGNHSDRGKVRTDKHNKKIVKLYHQQKL